MKTHRGFQLALATLFLLIGGTIVSADDTLIAGFHNPPLEARPSVYWDWLNGAVSLPDLTRDLEAMKAIGLRGADIFDVGAVNNSVHRLYPFSVNDDIVPHGPAFMGPESTKAIAHAVREATRLGLELSLITSSSYNAGGSWTKPENANMGLYEAITIVKGPKPLNVRLPFPDVPDTVPKRSDGLPVCYKDVAVLALPHQLVEGYLFIFQVDAPGVSRVNRLVLYNTKTDKPDKSAEQLYAKDFRVSVSTKSTRREDFVEVAHGTLKPDTDPQEFSFAAVDARYVKLELLSGYNADPEKIELGEFEVFSTDGKNVVAKYDSNNQRTKAQLLTHTSSALAAHGCWNAGNVNDCARSGPHGSWRSGRRTRVLRDLASVINLSDKVDGDGRLKWQVPAGRWTILRLVCTNTGQHLIVPSPNSDGLMIDHFNPRATEAHMRYIIEKLKKELGVKRFDDTALKTMYMCSYEPHGTTTWTGNFVEQFKRRRGYDPVPYLPILKGWKTVKDAGIAARFRYDYKRVIADLLVDAHYKQAKQTSNESGLLLCAEAGGPGGPVEALKALGSLDTVRGEFWIQTPCWVVKAVASAANIYGKKIVEMEAFTTGHHWQDGPMDYKPVADRAFCEGANRFVIHTFPHNPPQAGLPGWGYYAGVHFCPKLTWWSKAKPLIDYLARCSFMLQQGRFVGDVCYYYGGQAPNKIPPKHVRPSLGPGYDYDVVNAEVILDKMSVDDGRIALASGMRYEMLVLPDRADIDLEVLEKLEELVRNGATIVGRKPGRSAGLRDFPRRDQQVRQLADKLWGPCDGRGVTEHVHGKGKIVWGRTEREILRERHVGPDFTFASRQQDADLDYIHRRTAAADLYFVRNRTSHWVDADCTFRVAGRRPELWLPDSGEIRPQLVYDAVKAGTRMPLRLAPSGTVFVVFRKKAEGDRIERRQVVTVSHNGVPIFPLAADAGDSTSTPAVELLAAGKTGGKLLAWAPGTYTLKTASGAVRAAKVVNLPPAEEVSGPWEVRFAKGWGAPASKTLPNLVSWTKDDDEAVKFFSGSATYHKKLHIPAERLADDRRLVLDLGRVGVVADVTLNGRHLGILWKEPFRIDITDAARPGENKLVVEVTNVWRNRLIGDLKLPKEERHCRSNLFGKIWTKSPLIESGLLGPVRLLTGQQVDVTLPQE